MIGEMIKEYLVGLGVKIDKPGFAEFDSTINKTSGTIAAATGGWAKNFVTASGIIVTAIASVTTSVVGLMSAAAKQDLAMEKYARSMMVSKGAAQEMKLAVDALGESVQDIQLTPELFNRYKSLVADGRNMKVGGDYEGTMKGFRELIFEFTRLKQEASYALQWVGYYLIKYLSKPLAEAKASFKSFNDNLIKNMPVWTEKIARALVYIINIGRHFWDLLKAIGKTAYDVWDAFPRGIKIATAALAAFFLILKASPLSRMLALVGSLLLLADDYFGYMEGKQAAMGAIWDKLNGYIDTTKRKFAEWGNDVAPFWDQFVNYLIKAKDSAIDFGSKCMDWFDELSQSKALNDFVDTAKRLGIALWDLGSGIISLISDSVKSFLKSVEKHGAAVDFTDLMEKLLYIFLDLVDVISDGIEVAAKWLVEMGKSEVVRDFIDAVTEFLDVIVELIIAIVELVTVAFKAFFGELDKTDTVFSFKDALKAVVNVITAMIRGISSLIRGLVNLFKLMKDNRVFKAFWEGLGKVVKGFTDIVLGAIKMTGKLGQALLELLKGPSHWGKAWKIAEEAVFGDSKAEASGRRSGGFAGTGDEQRDAWIKEASKEYGVPAAIIAAVMQTESSFRPDAVSEAGCVGYMQLSPSTAESLGVDPYDPHENIIGGAKYLRKLYDMFGDWNLTFAAYNAGPGAVKSYNNTVPPYKETKDYVEKVSGAIDDFATLDEIASNGKSEGDNWYRVESEKPKYEQLHDLAKNGLEEVAQFYYDLTGDKLGLTSGMRNVELGYDPDEIGGHYTGLKVDVIGDRFSDPDVLNEFIRKCEAAGISVRNEYDDAQKVSNTTGDHLDLDMSNYRGSYDGEPPQYSIKNPPDDMRDPDEKGFVSRIGEAAIDFGGKVMDGLGKMGKVVLGETSSQDLTPTSSYVKMAMNNVDQFALQGLMSQQIPIYAQNHGAGTVNNVTYQVDVGGVSVQNTNASADDIGREVGSQTTSSIENRAQYIAQNKVLAGGPSWV